ncbi:MAG: DEAD/DEAH box helicase [Solirubrobacterales bacterium]
MRPVTQGDYQGNDCYLGRVGSLIWPPERFRFLRVPQAPWGRRISQDVQHSRRKPITSFADLGTSPEVVDALQARSIKQPFPIQEMVIRDALAGHDLLVQSPTGSGKTLAFGVPLVDLIEPRQKGPGALVLAPTRELAGQIVDELAGLADARGLRIAAVFGGVGFGPQIKAAGRADILVATPGRLEDLIGRGAVSLGRVRVLVLDEADRMLDMGFRPAVDRLVDRTPADRQTLFFSATLEGATGRVAAAYTDGARSHTHAEPPHAEAKIEHRFVAVDSQGAKLAHLVEHLTEDGAGRSLVFVRTKRGADRLVKRLRSQSVEAVAMHGDKSQRQREQALARFERGDVMTLVATDVAARGIDVPDVARVINYDAPEDREAYVHRVGRTGRAGATGTGISFVLADQAEEIGRIRASLGLEHGLREAPRQGTSSAAGASSTGKRRRQRRRRRPGGREGSRPRG